MGCDIHAYAEIKKPGSKKWEKIGAVFPLDEIGQKVYKKTHTDMVFDCRSYSLFGWLADVRNYSGVPPLSAARGLPANVSSAVMKAAGHWGSDGHNHSWFSLDELVNFDYDRLLEDRRCTMQVRPGVWDGGCTAPVGEGEMTTYREFLPDMYFRDLEILKGFADVGEVRIVFWFDN